MNDEYEDYDSLIDGTADEKVEPILKTDSKKEWEQYPATISVMPSVKAKGDQLELLAMTWSEVIAKFQHHSMNDEEPPVFSLARFEGGRRKENAKSACGVVVEVDGARWTIDEVERVIRSHGWCGIVYTTRSHTEADHHFRIVLPLLEPIPIERYERVVRHVDGLLGAQSDTSARRVTQFQRFPTGGSEIRIIEGHMLEPSSVPGGADHGEPIIPTGLTVFPSITGPSHLGSVKAVNPPAQIEALMDPIKAGSLDDVQRVAGVLSQVCVMNGELYRVRLPSRRWVSATPREALSLTKEHYSSIGSVTLEHQLIESVFKRALLPVVSGAIVSPVGSNWVEFNGQRYLNIGLAPRIEPTTLGDDGRALINFININLLADERAPHEIDADISDVESVSPTRWAWHWVAHQYQHPGVPLSTALWLVSHQQGIGKSLFGDLLRDLFGRPNTTGVNAAELRGDWNDWMEGKTFIVSDEANMMERKAFNTSIKRWVGNPEVEIRQRHAGMRSMPTTGTWLFLTNDQAPIALDHHDRRHMFVDAQGDLTRALDVIDSIREIISDRDRRESALGELGAYLDSIKVDSALIARALTSQMKADIIEATASPTERWFNHEVEHGHWREDQRRPNAALWSSFEEWAKSNGVYSGQITSAQFTLALRVIAKRGHIETYRTKSERGYRLVRLPSGVVVLEHDEVMSPGAKRFMQRMRQDRIIQ